MVSWHTVEPLDLDLSKYGTENPQPYRVWRGVPFTVSQWRKLNPQSRLQMSYDIQLEKRIEWEDNCRKEALKKKVLRDEALEAGDKDKFVKLSRDHGLKESDIAAQLIIHDSLERKQHD